MGAAMSRWVMTTLTCGLAIMASLADVEAASGAAALSYRVERNEFDVSTGAIQEQPGRGLAIEVPEVRAVLRVRTAQAAALHFTYLGPTAGSKPLASGELRRQLGLKLRARDSCNVVYVMWHIAPDEKIAVSVKRNPGQRTHAECGAHGYTNIRPHRALPVSPIVPGVSRTLRVDLRGTDLTVQVDDAAVWEGSLPAEIAAFDGPVGLRSDNVRFLFEYYVPGPS